MIYVLWIGILLSSSYVFLIYSFLRHWELLPEWKPPLYWKAGKTKVSVIIPARNEAENIESCLSSLIQQDYPSELFEIIIIDDHSTDKTPVMVTAFNAKNVKLFRLADYPVHTQNSYKKAALELGISQAMGDLIVTTDADCIAEQTWLSYLVSYHEDTGKKLIAAPVIFHGDHTLLEQFQALDYMGMMLMTGAGIHGGFLSMSNGANLAYLKKVFQQVNGFEHIDQLASGDDLLLVQKILKKQADAMGFVKSTEATIKSLPQHSWRTFFQQRLRWAGKSTVYTDNTLKVVQMIVFFICAVIILLPIASIWLGKNAIFTAIGLFMVKALADFILLKRAAVFFNRSDLMRIFIPAEFIHTFYIFVVGMVSTFVKSYKWKGRRVR